MKGQVLHGLWRSIGKLPELILLILPRRHSQPGFSVLAVYEKVVRLRMLYNSQPLASWFVPRFMGGSASIL
jgi:hypothetical protein